MPASEVRCEIAPGSHLLNPFTPILLMDCSVPGVPLPDSDEEVLRLRDRQQVIEEAVMHLQHDLSRLNSALVDQQFQLSRIQRLLEDFGDRLERIDPFEKRDPASERPPHY